MIFNVQTKFKRLFKNKDNDIEKIFNVKQEQKTNLFITKVIELEDTTCSNQKGKFPCVSSRGRKYIMTVYCYDANAILLRPNWFGTN